MDTPPAPSFRRIREIFEAALECSPEEQEGFLEQSCGGDSGLRLEVQRMLARDGSSAFVDHPAWEGFAELLAEDAGPAIGSQLGPYRVEVLLGGGGMGRVYRATDTRLPRPVALKIYRREFDQHFEREAGAVAALNHPHICSLYDIGPNYLVMELVQGPTLAERIKAGPVSCQEALRIACEIAEALEAAHQKGVRHGDLKPANIMLGAAGEVKVLDFGLATLLTEPGREAPATRPESVQPSVVMGTVAYLSPEQSDGQRPDARSEVFSLGVVLYETLCGRRPFRGETARETLTSIAKDNPEPPCRIRREIPRRLERILLRCLAKRPDARYQSAGELRRDLREFQARLTSTRSRMGAAAIAASVTLATGVAALGVRSYIQSSRARWAETEAPEIVRLMDGNHLMSALRLYRQAQQYSPSSPAYLAIRPFLQVTPISIETTPPGARIYVSDYGDVRDDGGVPGEFLGISPLRTDRIPFLGYYRIHALKDGLEPIERAFTPGSTTTVRLVFHTPGATPAGMVWIPAAPAGAYLTPAPAAALPEFWLDRYEVSNRQFKNFVDAGGYQRREFWKKPFVKSGRPLSWDQAMAAFHEATGEPGPATWEHGTFPEGRADFPVGGVSWYEAAAYAEFAGKSLPTVYNWYRAAGVGFFSDILNLSNFSGKGPEPVGKNRGVGAFGAYDMAGNVQEWAVNPASNLRYLLGGAWNEASDQFVYPDARDPFDREATFGFRCAKYPVAPMDALSGPVPFVSRDRRTDPPADQRAFEIYKDLHSYEKTALDASVESVDDSSPYFRRETVTFRAAYGDERMKAHLFLPKNAAPPYQVVAFYGGGAMFVTRSIAELKDPFEFVVRSGRALIIPAYKGTLERGPAPDSRETMLAWSKDLGRSIDYLETRQDIDTRELAFYGLSDGAVHGVRLVAVEPRFKTAVLLSGGSTYRRAAEVDPWNFAPWVKIPVLMLNGRDDFTFPLETNTIPLFRALGTEEKRQLLFDGGHVNLLTRMDLVKGIVDWLNRYLGSISSR